MYAYMYAMTKVISISDDAYERLQKAKEEKESFSRVILRVVEEKKRRSLTEFFGALPEESETFYTPPFFTQ